MPSSVGGCVLFFFFPQSFCGGFLRGGGGTLGNPNDSDWEDWGTLGKIRGITNPQRLLGSQLLTP